MLGINNEDCFKTIQKIQDQGRKVGLVLTSPPYNTGRNSTDSKRRDTHEARYDIHLDNMTDSEYLDWTTALFNGFETAKKVKSVAKTGQKFYENVYNFVEARNNDGANKLNKATFSSELVLKLLDMYYTKGVVYDPFMGTGSTGVACEMLGIKWLGSEISTAQCEYARKRLEEI